MTLDKGDTYTDWAKRPLSDTQVEYALNDVRYLPEVYRRLDGRARSGGPAVVARGGLRPHRGPRDLRVPSASEQWRRVKRISSLNRRQLAVAREVAAWREIEAQRRDVPKRWVLGDESIDRDRSPGAHDRRGARGHPRRVATRSARSAQAAVLGAVAAGLAVPDAELPSLAKRRRPARRRRRRGRPDGRSRAAARARAWRRDAAAGVARRSRAARGGRTGGKPLARGVAPDDGRRRAGCSCSTAQLTHAPQ